MHLNVRQGIVLPAIIGLVALLANAAVFFGRTYPAARERSAAQALYDRNESELHVVRQQIRSLETVGRGALAAGSDLQGFLDQRLLDDSRWPEVSAYLRDSAADAGVRLERVDHSEESVQQLDAVRRQMSVLGAGSYAAVRSWLLALQQGPGLFFVDQVEIDGSGAALLSVQLTAIALTRADSPVKP